MWGLDGTNVSVWISSFWWLYYGCVGECNFVQEIIHWSVWGRWSVLLTNFTQMVDKMVFVLFLQLLCKFEIISKEKQKEESLRNTCQPHFLALWQPLTELWWIRLTGFSVLVFLSSALRDNIVFALVGLPSFSLQQSSMGFVFGKDLSPQCWLF